MPWVTIPIGALASVTAGLVVCLPALRLRGPYLSLVTLAFPLILLGVIFSFTGFTGGELGVSGIARISNSRISDFYISFAVMIVSVMIMWKLTDAKSALVRTGLIFHAIREDEIAARASGINTIRYKLLAFAVGGFFAGIAGAFHAHFMRIAGPSNLDLFLSFQVIIWTVFGGITSIYGPVVGVFIMYPLMEYLPIILGKMHIFTEKLPNFTEIRMLIFAVIVVVILLFMPEGIAVFIRDKMEQQCPRCKLSNVWWRRTCRACSTNLR
jgi:branched-chain amino acid transport system permease protein